MPKSTDPFDSIKKCCWRCNQCDELDDTPAICYGDVTKYIPAPAVRHAVIGWLRDKANKYMDRNNSQAEQAFDAAADQLELVEDTK